MRTSVTLSSPHDSCSLALHPGASPGEVHHRDVADVNLRCSVVEKKNVCHFTGAAKSSLINNVGDSVLKCQESNQDVQRAHQDLAGISGPVCLCEKEARWHDEGNAQLLECLFMEKEEKKVIRHRNDCDLSNWWELRIH